MANLDVLSLALGTKGGAPIGHDIRSYLMGKAISGSIVQDDALVFYADSAFTLGVSNATKNWNGTLYYSTDHSTWNTWNGSTINSGAHLGKQCIYLRGVGNTVITGANDQTKRFVVSGNNVICDGNVDNILDYMSSPVLGRFAYAYLFFSCSKVDFNVTLPSTTLADNCYRSMFHGCSALTKAPKLPSTTLSTTCYFSMFANCTSLVVLPDLAATSLRQYCYYDMFAGCSKIKFSATQTGAYQTPYRIPSSGTGTNASDALTGMFNSTGGTFKGTPSLNTTYYTSNIVV